MTFIASVVRVPPPDESDWLLLGGLDCPHWHASCRSLLYYCGGGNERVDFLGLKALKVLRVP